MGLSEEQFKKMVETTHRTKETIDPNFKMDYPEFQRRVLYNTKVLVNGIIAGTNLLELASRVYTWHYAPGELHFSVLQRKSHDIIPSLFLGLLAQVDVTGVDANEMLPDGSIVDVEIKTSEINSREIWAGPGRWSTDPNPGLYTGIQNIQGRRTAITSRLCGAYHCNSDSCKSSKNMRTVLMIADTAGENSYVDGFELDGDTVMDYLNRSDCASRTIKLASFLKAGKPCKTVWPLETFPIWKSRIAAKARKVAPGKFS